MMSCGGVDVVIKVEGGLEMTPRFPTVGEGVTVWPLIKREMF